jgi:hypothetical protein
METNEQLQTALLHEAEHAILQIVDQLQTIREGDLQALEQQILASCLALGGKVLEQTLRQAGELRPEERGNVDMLNVWWECGPGNCIPCWEK